MASYVCSYHIGWLDVMGKIRVHQLNRVVIYQRTMSVVWLLLSEDGYYPGVSIIE